MLLLPFVVLSGFGFGLWLLGHYFQYTGIATIGAVMIIAVGGAVAITDLEQRSGQQIEKDYTVVDNSTVNNQTTVSYTYERTSLTSVLGENTGQLGLGALTMVVGGLLITHHVEEVSS